METGLKRIKELFDLKDKDIWRTYSPLTLAYIGDGVYELVIRTILVKKGNCPVNQLHKKSQQSGKGRSAVFHDGAMRPISYRRKNIAVYKRGRKCTFSYNGQACNNGRLPQGYRV